MSNREIAPRYPVGDCHVGECKRPADHRGQHGEPTATESRTLNMRGPAACSVGPFDSDDWATIVAESRRH